VRTNSLIRLSILCEACNSSPTPTYLICAGNSLSEVAATSRTRVINLDEAKESHRKPSQITITMLSRPSQVIALAALCLSTVQAHTVITYPGWRGDNLITNETWPYGMQWMYPCEYSSFVLPIASPWPQASGEYMANIF
jgi:hypothetical protein